MTATLAVKASGMVTAVGLNAPASLAAMRAGIRNVNQTNLWDMYSGTELAAGKVPLPQWWAGIGKLADLAAPAILECLEAAKPVPATNVPILLGVAPSDRPFRMKGLDQQILPEIEHRLRVRLHPASHVIARDHVSIVVALREAVDLLRNKQVAAVIVAAVDSLLQHDLKDYYLSKYRLLTPVNSNGFSMGEAGSAVLVTPAGASAKGELQILSMSTAREKATLESDEPLRAEALTQVIRETLRQSGLTIQDVHYRITDLNGEHYKFKEMSLAINRFVRNPTPNIFDLWHPIEFIGDVGAAIGPIVLGVALHASQKGYGMGPTVLCTLGNDDGERAALLVHYDPQEKKQ
jgi:3-oxoacyl-[acyl-carrier-protein] synthase-1